MKRNTVAAIVTVLIVSGFFLFAVGFSVPHGKLAVQDDGVTFGMTAGQLKGIKGEPTETEKEDEWHIERYFFKEDLYGREARSYYEFKRVLFLTQLVNASYIVDRISVEDAKELAQMIEDSLKSYYEGNTNFTDEGLSSGEDSDFFLSMHMGSGAVNISYDIVYRSYGQLTIDVTSLY
ncbi:MAG: hypothetical protein IKS19_06545 [Clostridia bacterium]|nr:hypothetical protein [Clostridia bacterium]